MPMIRDSYKDLEKKIEVKFTTPSLLENVFIHRSYLNEHKILKMQSNEKLEFLGDSVLSLITSIYLYKTYPDLQEGDYTDIKSSIVRTESLAEAANNLGLGEYLLLSKGEEAGLGRSNTNILADCFEALVAAIFIDQGFQAAHTFVLSFLFSDKLTYIVDHKLYLSPKSRLQELLQANYKVLPVYKLELEAGPEHKKTFTVAVFLKSKKLASATGKSKKQAEELAAKNALERMDK